MPNLINLGGLLYFTKKQVLVEEFWIMAWGDESTRLLAQLEDAFLSGVANDDFGISGKLLAEYAGVSGLIAPMLNKFADRLNAPIRPNDDTWKTIWAYYFDRKTKVYWFYRHPKASSWLKYPKPQ